MLGRKPAPSNSLPNPALRTPRRRLPGARWSKPCYDRESLYLRIESELPDPVPEFGRVVRAANAATNEALEIVLDPSGLRQPFYRFIAGPSPGSRYEGATGLVTDENRKSHKKLTKELAISTGKIVNYHLRHVPSRRVSENFGRLIFAESQQKMEPAQVGAELLALKCIDYVGAIGFGCDRGIRVRAFTQQ